MSLSTPENSSQFEKEDTTTGKIFYSPGTMKITSRLRIKEDENNPVYAVFTGERTIKSNKEKDFYHNRFDPPTYKRTTVTNLEATLDENKPKEQDKENPKHTLGFSLQYIYNTHELITKMLEGKIDTAFISENVYNQFLKAYQDEHDRRHMRYPETKEEVNRLTKVVGVDDTKALTIMNKIRMRLEEKNI